MPKIIKKKTRLTKPGASTLKMSEKGKQKKKSDIDILVDLHKTLGLEFIELADLLEEKLGRKVDVATFEHFKRSFHNPRYKHIAEDIKKSMIYV